MVVGITDFASTVQDPVAAQVRSLQARLEPISTWGRNYNQSMNFAIGEQRAREAEQQRQIEEQQRRIAEEREREELLKRFEEYEANLDKKGGSVTAPKQNNSGGGDSGDYSNWKPTSSMQQNALNLIEATGAEGKRLKILENAASMIGTPYAWGGGGYGVRKSRGIGKGTENVIGVDCSGLTSYVYGKVGLKLPRHSNSQTAVGVKTKIDNAKPGDLVGWNRGGHVAIYVGNGYIIESPKPGHSVRLRKIGSNEGIYAVKLDFK